MDEALPWVLAAAGLASLPALAWHLIAWGQLRRLASPVPSPPPAPSPPLTLFKACPQPLVPGPALEALESFLVQLHPGDALRLGAPGGIPDALRQSLQEHCPGVDLSTTALPTEGGPANPKIRSLRLLSQGARGGLWLWSDADMAAPPGFVDALRSAWARRGSARLIAAPYHIPDLRRPAALLDAAVAHLQVIPGLLFLSRRKDIDFAVGSAALFEAEDFQREVDWDELGAALADDHLLGRRLAPVRFVPQAAATPAAAGSWREAWGHALRWQRTIHGCNPAASLAHGAVLPLLAWTAALALHPSGATAAGLALCLTWESAWTALCHRTCGARLSPAAWAALPAAVLARTALWLAAWLPGSVRWGSGSWKPAWLPPLPTAAARLLPQLLPWAAWAAAAPLPPAARALAALTTWWAAHARWTASLKPVDAVFGLHFALQAAWTLPSGCAVNALLLAMAVLSLLRGSPFTLAYAREETPPERWGHPLFLQANRVLTALWTAAFFFNTLWFGVDPVLPTPWNWIPPAAALLAAGAFTKCLPILYTKRMLRSPAP